jgi:hypothetical protein
MMTCKQCKEEHSEDNFYFNKKTGYYSTSCKDCYIGNVLNIRRNNKKTCSLEHCDKKHYGLGYCRTHYERYKTGGEENLTKVFRVNIDEPANLDKYGITLEEYKEFSKDGCMICNSNNKEFFVIEHDHACCEEAPYCGDCTRGVVCYSCNANIARYEMGVMHKSNPLKDKVVGYLVNYDIRRKRKESK